MSGKDIIMIRQESTVEKISKEQEQKMMNILKASFEDLFESEGNSNAKDN